MIEINKMKNCDFCLLARVTNEKKFTLTKRKFIGKSNVFDKTNGKMTKLVVPGF